LKPLATAGGAATVAFWIAAGGWAVIESALAVRTTLATKARRDPSFALLSVTTYGAFVLAVVVAHREPGLALPGPGWWPVVAGLVLVAFGLSLRMWAIRELGRFFTYAVVVHPEHTVVDTGPYRWVRHPSYTGLLLGLAGMGLALGTWLSILVALLPPVAGFKWRLLTEEQVLARELGDSYRDYMGRTKRLIPGVW
jgi:protein-S-isoprenylcysteine O-methyltransferase